MLYVHISSYSNRKKTVYKTKQKIKTNNNLKKISELHM